MTQIISGALVRFVRLGVAVIYKCVCLFVCFPIMSLMFLSSFDALA